MEGRQKMRCAYVIGTPAATLCGVGGAPTHVKQIIYHLRLRGLGLESYLGGDLGAKPVEWRPSNRKLKRSIRQIIPAFLWETVEEILILQTNRKLFFDLFAPVQSFSPDVIYERRAYRYHAVMRLAEKLHIPRVIEVNEPFIFDERCSHSLLNSFVNKKELESIASADRVSIISEVLAQHYVKLGVSPRKIRVIPNAVDPVLFNKSDIDRTLIQHKLGIADRIVIGFTGWFTPYHRVDLLIKALVRLNRPDVILLVVGDGMVKGDLEQKAAKLNCKQQVIFTGLVPYEQVPEYIAAMDITVMPASNWWGSPIKLFEYGAMGKPIIAPRVGPVEEVMEDGIDGQLITSGSLDELVKAIRAYLDHPDWAAKCAETFRRKVLSKYTWNHVADKIVQLFEEVLEERRSTKEKKQSEETCLKHFS